MKRLFDLVVAAIGLALTLPLLGAIATIVWVSDRRSPLYVAPRIGAGGAPFNMVKFRTMIVGADQLGIDSTAGDDPRITRVGRVLRRWKLDELPQLWNVLLGDMSLVGPRPNVARETASYTDEENQLLNVRPGMTDLASVVFSDEGEILHGCADPDLAYNQFIRPWKSRLALLYVRSGRSLILDLRLILITIIAVVSRRRALSLAVGIVTELGASAELTQIATRQAPLPAAPPPGATQIVQQRTFSRAI